MSVQLGKMGVRGCWYGGRMKGSRNGKDQYALRGPITQVFVEPHEQQDYPELLSPCRIGTLTLLL